VARNLPPRILTIAGSDSGGGAGIQADLKTILALGGYGMSALTALTAQNTCGVSSVHAVPPDFVADQIDSLAEDIGIDAAKTGMLNTAAVVAAVAERVAHHRIEPLVVDPVMVSKSGARLLQPTAEDALREDLVPLATVLTPNLPEARMLSGIKVSRPDQMRDAARAVLDLGPDAVVIKGGHLEGEPVDLFYDGEEFAEITYPRVETKNTHGTGCTYSAAIATCLGGGMEPTKAVRTARKALQRAIEKALPLGAGHGPLDHRAMFGVNWTAGLRPDP
jgi:hydroxymethylpyrimidine kinase/phosphomethylpyrimidine kinase